MNEVLFIFLQGVVVVVLMYLMGTTADRFLVPVLTVFSALLKLTPTVAGCTLLAFANGAPDMFTSLAAFTGSDSEDGESDGASDLGIANLLGGGLLVTTLVFGLVILKGCSVCIKEGAPPKVKSATFSFVRDVVVYLIAIVMLLYIAIDGQVNVWETILLVGMYILYVLSLTLGPRVWKQIRSILNLAENEEFMGKNVKGSSLKCDCVQTDSHVARMEGGQGDNAHSIPCSTCSQGTTAASAGVETPKRSASYAEVVKFSPKLESQKGGFKAENGKEAEVAVGESSLSTPPGPAYMQAASPWLVPPQGSADLAANARTESRTHGEGGHLREEYDECGSEWYTRNYIEMVERLSRPRHHEKVPTPRHGEHTEATRESMFGESMETGDLSQRMEHHGSSIEGERMSGDALSLSKAGEITESSATPVIKSKNGPLEQQTVSGSDPKRHVSFDAPAISSPSARPPSTKSEKSGVFSPVFPTRSTDGRALSGAQDGLSRRPSGSTRTSWYSAAAAEQLRLSRGAQGAFFGTETQKSPKFDPKIPGWLFDFLGWEEMRSVERILSVLELPATVARRLTVPMVEEQTWSRTWNSISVGAFPLFAYLIFMNFSISSWVVAGSLVGTGLLLGLCSYFTIPSFGPPERRYFHILFVLVAFTSSCMWIYVLANTVVDLLQDIGETLNIPQSILGVTVLALGNSLGDLISNVSLAGSGYPKMAAAGCFGGPIFNVMFGAAVPLMIQTYRQYPTPYPMGGGDIEGISFLFLTASVLSSLVIVIIMGFYLTRVHGFFLVTFYFVFLVMAILTIKGTIPAVTIH